MNRTDRIPEASKLAMAIAVKHDLQFAILVAQGAVAWAARAVTGEREAHKTDPDFAAAFTALGRIMVRLAAKSREMGGEKIKIAVDVRGDAFAASVTSVDLNALKPSACVVLIRNGKIAAIRSRKHGGALELPGGKAEFDEAPFTNAARECSEEVGVRPVYIRTLTREECGGFDCSCFLVESDDELVSSSEGEAVWVTPNELLTGTYASHTAKWLPMVAKELAAR